MKIAFKSLSTDRPGLEMRHKQWLEIHQCVCCLQMIEAKLNQFGGKWTYTSDVPHAHFITRKYPLIYEWVDMDIQFIHPDWKVAPFEGVAVENTICAHCMDNYFDAVIRLMRPNNPHIFAGINIGFEALEGSGIDNYIDYYRKWLPLMLTFPKGKHYQMTYHRRSTRK